MPRNDLGSDRLAFGLFPESHFENMGRLTLEPEFKMALLG